MSAGKLAANSNSNASEQIKTALRAKLESLSPANNPAPTPLDDIRFGPGPLPLPTMKSDEFKQYWLDINKKYGGFADFDSKKQFPKDGSLEAYLDRELNPVTATMSQLGAYGALTNMALDGMVHRSTKDFDGVGAIEMTKDTMKMMHELLQLPKGARIALQDGGGHGGGYNIWLNVLAKDTTTPVVVMDFGAFGSKWAADLNKEFAAKGHMGKMVIVKVEEGEVPTRKNIEADLLKAGVIETQKINMLFTSHETGTGAMVSPENMQELLNWSRTDKVVSDFTSAIMCQNIPGMKEGDKKQVFGFGALQKVPRGPNLGLVVIPEGSDSVLLQNGALPNPSYTNFTIEKNGKVQINEMLFSGEAITRSIDMKHILQLNFAATYLLNRGGLDASIKRARESARMVQEEIQSRISKANGRPELEFLVSNPANRGAFNIVLKKGSGLYDITTTELQQIKANAKRILAREGFAKNIAPYPVGNPDAVFRFTTLGIENQAQAKQLVDALYYGLHKALHIHYGQKLAAQERAVTLVAEDQFLYREQADVDAAIARKQSELSAKGIKFIDARSADVDYSKLSAGQYVVYKPALEGAQITAEYEKIRQASANNAIIVAAKKVPDEARFAAFIREGAGVNNIPLSQAEKDGHVVVNCPGVNSEVTARNTLNALLGHKHIENFASMAEGGKASASNLQPLYGPSPAVDMDALNAKIRGKTIAVLGAGDVGTQTILKLLESSAAKVKVYSRSLAEKDWSQRIKLLPTDIKNKLVICQSVDEAVKGANVLINHMALVPGLPAAGGTVDTIVGRHFALMADKCEVIDASRPEVICPTALIAAHKSGKVTKITVDFDTPEKAPENTTIARLFAYAKEHESFLYSPHAFADTDPKVRENMLNIALQQAEEVSAGKVYNFAGKGQLPEGFENCGKRKPAGIRSLESFLDKAPQKATGDRHANAQDVSVRAMW